jgi:hypothetical protein
MKQHKPRSVQRQAVLKLFETQDSVTKYDAATAIGLSPISAANLLNAMVQDAVIRRGPDVEGKSGQALRTFVSNRKCANKFLTMAIRRKNNDELGIESVRGWA